MLPSLVIQITSQSLLPAVTKLVVHQKKSAAARQVPIQTILLVRVAKVVFIVAGAIQKVRSVRIRQFVHLCFQKGSQALTSSFVRSYQVCLISEERLIVLRRREFGVVGQTLLFAYKLITTNDDLTV